MKKKSTSKSAFFNLRILTASAFCLAGIAVALFAMGAFSSAFAQPRHKQQPIANGTGCARHTDSGRSAHGWSCPSGPRLAKAPLRPAKRGVRRKSPDPLSARDRRATKGGPLLAMVAKAAQKSLAADAHDAGAASDL